MSIKDNKDVTFRVNDWKNWLKKVLKNICDNKNK